MSTGAKEPPVTIQKPLKDSEKNVPTHQDVHSRFRPTHFLSFPIAAPDVTGKISSHLLNFSPLTSTLDPKTLISERNLHITIGVLQLPTAADIQHATTILRDHCTTIDQHQPLLIDLHALDIMQNNPRLAHVLYAKVQDRSKKRSLHDLCESVRQKMINSGYMKQDHRPLKLHVTLINTIYGTKTLPAPATQSSSSTRIAAMKMKRRRKTFDARNILEALGDTHWGTLRLDTLHLMKMGRTGPMKTYESVSSFKI